MSVTKEQIERAIKASYMPRTIAVNYELTDLVEAYKEAIEALREVLACEPEETDIRIPYYNIQVDRENWWIAQEIIDKYPQEE